MRKQIVEKLIAEKLATETLWIKECRHRRRGGWQYQRFFDRSIAVCDGRGFVERKITDDIVS